MSETFTLPGWALHSWQCGVHGSTEHARHINSSEELLSELDRLRMQRPQYVELVAPGVGALCLGIAPSIAAVEWREGDELRHIVRAIATPGVNAFPEVEFEAPGGSLEFEADYLLPYTAAVKIILHCLQHGSFPQWAPQERQRVGSLDVERRE